MAKENTGLKIRLKKLDEMRNYLLQDIKHDLMSKKQKRMCRTLNYFEHSLLFISAVTDCVLIFAFVSLARIPIGISSSAVLLKYVYWLQQSKGISQLFKKRTKKIVAWKT